MTPFLRLQQFGREDAGVCDAQRSAARSQLLRSIAADAASGAAAPRAGAATVPRRGLWILDLRRRRPLSAIAVAAAVLVTGIGASSFTSSTETAVAAAGGPGAAAWLREQPAPAPAQTDAYARVQAAEWANSQRSGDRAIISTVMPAAPSVVQIAAGGSP